MGKKVENSYEAFLKKYTNNCLEKYIVSSTVEHSSREQDMHEHWDIGIRYDVKSLKKILRKHDFQDENYTWVEINNVEGKPGWLYGEATHFIFETIDYLIVVEKDKLKEFVEEKCKDKIRCTVPTLYQLYKRNKWGRKDIITLIKTIDLIYLSDCMIKKSDYTIETPNNYEIRKTF
jgi:hypothetical protein